MTDLLTWIALRRVHGGGRRDRDRAPHIADYQGRLLLMQAYRVSPLKLRPVTGEFRAAALP